MIVDKLGHTAYRKDRTKQKLRDLKESANLIAEACDDGLS